MEKLYDKLWEKTKNWKFDPFVFIVCLFTFNYNFLLIIFNIFILILYCKLDKKYSFKYSKKFLISYVLGGAILLISIIMIVFPVIFVLGFDDAGNISSETKSYIITMLFMGISLGKILFSLFISKKSQKYKRLAYSEYEINL